MNVDQLQQLVLSASQEVALAEKGVKACQTHATKLNEQCNAQARATQEEIAALRQRLEKLQTEAAAQVAEHKKLRDAQAAKLSKAEQLVALRQRALLDIRQKLKDAKKMAERAAAAKAAKARAQAAIASAQASSSKVARRTTKVGLRPSPVAPSPEDTLATIEFTYCYNSKGKLTSPEPMTFRLRRKHSQGTVFHVGRAGGGLVDDESSWLELDHNPGMSGNHLELYLATNHRKENASDPFAIKVTHHGTNDTVLCNRPSKKTEKMRKKHPYDLKTGTELTINDNSVITITAIHFADPTVAEGSLENGVLANTDYTAAAASITSLGGNTVEAILRLLQVGGSTLNRRRYTFVFTQGPGDPVVPLVVGSGADKAAALASLRPSSAALSDVELMTVLGDANVPTCLLELQLRADTDDGHKNEGTPSGIFVRAATPQAEGLAQLRGEPLAAAWREVEANDVLAVSQDSVYQVLSVELSVASDDASATAESNAPQTTRVQAKAQRDAVQSNGKGVLSKKGSPAPGGAISENPSTLPQSAANTTSTDEYDWEGTAATVQAAAGELHSNLQSPAARGHSSLSSSVAVSEAEVASANVELGDMFSGMGMDVAGATAGSAQSGENTASAIANGAFTDFSSSSASSTGAVSLAPTEVPSRFGKNPAPTSSRSPRAGQKRKTPLVDTSLGTYDAGMSPGSGRNSGAVTPNALRRGTMRLVTDRNERVELSRQKRRCGVRASPTFFKRGRYRDEDSGSGSEATGSYRRAKGTPSPVVARVAKNWKADYDSADEGEEEFERRRGSASKTRKMGGAGRAKGHGVGQLRDEVPIATGTGDVAAPVRTKTAAVLKLNPAVQNTITTTTSPRTGTVCEFTSPKLPTPSQDVQHPIARRGGFRDGDLAAGPSEDAPEAQQGTRSPLEQEGRPLPISRAARVSLAIQQSPTDPLVLEKAAGARVKDEAPAPPAGCRVEILLRLPRPKRGKRKSAKKGASPTGNEAEVYRIELDSSKSNTRACVLGRVLHGRAGQLQHREIRRRMEFSASSISGTHAELFLSRTGSGPADFGVCVRDCDSTNGTFHNNRRLQFTAAWDGDPLREGDRLVLGAKSTGLALRVVSIRPVEVAAASETAASKDEAMAGARKRSKRAVGVAATATPRASQPASPQQGTASPATHTHAHASTNHLQQGETSPAAVVAGNSTTSTVLPSTQGLPTAPDEGRKVVLLMKFDSPEIRNIRAKVAALGNADVLEDSGDVDFSTVTHVLWKSRAHGLLKALVAGCKIVFGMEWLDACAKANRWLPLKESFDHASILRPGAPENEREYCCVRSASNPFNNRLWVVTSPLVQVASSRVLKTVRFFAHLCQSKELPIVDKRTLPSGEVEYISTGECLSGGRCSADRGTALRPNFVIDHVLTQAYSRNNLPPCLVLSAEGMLEFLLGKKPRVSSSTTATGSTSSSPTDGLQSTYEIARAQNIQGNEAELRRIICQSN